MNSKIIINGVVFILNSLFTTVLALAALWSSLPKFIYFLWLSIGIVSTIYFAFYFKRFTNWTQLIIKSLVHGCLTYSVLWVFSVIQGIGPMFYKLFS